MKPEIRISPVFICGHYRSGTSLLNHLLDGHAQVLALPIETKFFTAFIPEWQKDGDAKSALAHSLMRHLYPAIADDYHRHYGQTDSETFISRFEERVPLNSNDPAQFLNTYVHTCQTFLPNPDTVTIWVEKTPVNEVFYDEIMQLWPDARFIHVYRDPRDLHHTVRARSDFPLHPRTTAHNWLRSIRYMRRNQKLAGDGRYITLSYEELVYEPDEQMRRIAGFLDIPFDQTLLQPSSGLGSTSWEGNAQHDSFSGVSTKSVGKWRTSPFLDEIQMVEMLCRSTMDELGYELDFKPTGMDKLHADMQQIMLRLKEFRAFLKGGKKGTY